MGITCSHAWTTMRLRISRCIQPAQPYYAQLVLSPFKIRILGIIKPITVTSFLFNFTWTGNPMLYLQKVWSSVLCWLHGFWSNRSFLLQLWSVWPYWFGKSYFCNLINRIHLSFSHVVCMGFYGSPLFQGCAKQRGDTSYEVSPTLCFKCGEEGHFARGCTTYSKV